MAELSTLQSRLDGLHYPPTHQYQIASRQPTGLLGQRIRVIERDFPHFFRGDLLDVGCNKGFFSFYHKGPYVGIDPGSEFIRLCCDMHIGSDRMFIEASFGSFVTEKYFNRIFIGNGPHYPFIEARGWSWVRKLTSMSCDQVLLEGPIDMTGRDAQQCIPADLAPLFNPEARDEAFAPYYRKVKEVRSPLVDRWFTLYAKDALWTVPTDVYGKQYIASIYELAKAYTRETDTIMEICTRKYRGVLSQVILPHAKFIPVDRNPERIGLNLDALTDELPSADVTISTAILHHTAPGNIGRLLANIARSTRRTIILSGPNVEAVPDLFGDHKYHISVPEMRGHMQRLGFEERVVYRVGLTEPFSEVFMVFERCG